MKKRIKIKAAVIFASLMFFLCSFIAFTMSTSTSNKGRYYVPSLIVLGTNVNEDTIEESMRCADKSYFESCFNALEESFKPFCYRNSDELMNNVSIFRSDVNGYSTFTLVYHSYDISNILEISNYLAKTLTQKIQEELKIYTAAIYTFGDEGVLYREAKETPLTFLSVFFLICSITPACFIFIRLSAIKKLSKISQYDFREIKV